MNPAQSALRQFVVSGVVMGKRLTCLTASQAKHSAAIVFGFKPLSPTFLDCFKVLAQHPANNVVVASRSSNPK